MPKICFREEMLRPFPTLRHQFYGKHNLPGGIKFYYQDFVAVEKEGKGKQVNWIIETKGQVYEAVPHKEISIIDWCKKVFAQTGDTWGYIIVHQKVFYSGKSKRFSELVDHILGQSVAPLLKT